MACLANAQKCLTFSNEDKMKEIHEEDIGQSHLSLNHIFILSSYGLVRK